MYKLMLIMIALGFCDTETYRARQQRNNELGNSFKHALFYGRSKLEFGLTANVPNRLYAFAGGGKVAYSRVSQRSRTDRYKLLQVGVEFTRGAYVFFDRNAYENLHKIFGQDEMWSVLLAQIWGGFFETPYYAQEFGYKVGLSHLTRKFEEKDQNEWHPAVLVTTRSILIPKNKLSPYFSVDLGYLKIVSIEMGVNWEL